MNKKGVGYLGWGLALFIWIMGIMFIPYITDVIDASRVDLDCSNSSLGAGDRLLCLGIDTIVPYIIWTLMVIAIKLIIGRGT